MLERLRAQGRVCWSATNWWWWGGGRTAQTCRRRDDGECAVFSELRTAGALDKARNRQRSAGVSRLAGWPALNDDESVVRASAVLKSQGRGNWPRGRPGWLACPRWFSFHVRRATPARRFAAPNRAALGRNAPPGGGGLIRSLYSQPRRHGGNSRFPQAGMENNSQKAARKCAETGAKPRRFFLR